VLLRDADGNSTISAADLALAIVDEIETPAHRRARFTAIH
jgi:putative NADH-flavin reductase